MLIRVGRLYHNLGQLVKIRNLVRGPFLNYMMDDIYVVKSLSTATCYLLIFNVHIHQIRIQQHRRVTTQLQMFIGYVIQIGKQVILSKLENYHLGSEGASVIPTKRDNTN